VVTGRKGLGRLAEPGCAPPIAPDHISGNTIKIPCWFIAGDLLATGDFSCDKIDGLVGEIAGCRAASAFEEFLQLAANDFVFSPGSVSVMVEDSQHFIEGILSQIAAFPYLNRAGRAGCEAVGVRCVRVPAAGGAPLLRLIQGDSACGCDILDVSRRTVLHDVIKNLVGFGVSAGGRRSASS